MQQNSKQAGIEEVAPAVQKVMLWIKVPRRPQPCWLTKCTRPSKKWGNSCVFTKTQPKSVRATKAKKWCYAWPGRRKGSCLETKALHQKMTTPHTTFRSVEKYCWGTHIILDKNAPFMTIHPACPKDRQQGWNQEPPHGGDSSPGDTDGEDLTTDVTEKNPATER